MTRSQSKLLQYLGEAHATELGLARVLQSQIMMAPRGSYRKALETHLEETRAHARRVRERERELGGGDGILGGAVTLVEGTLAQMIALAKTPLDLVRGSGGEEKVLKNAKDACATEALEIATYTAIEKLAEEVGDRATARLAASIRAEEERMLERVLRELPRLTEAVVRADVDGRPSYELGGTGAADVVREAGRGARTRAEQAGRRTRQAARSTRRIPGAARVEGRVRGATASAGDLPIAGYDGLNAGEIIQRLPSLTQEQLAEIDSYERRHDGRSTVLDRIHALQRGEPWAGYDELTAAQVKGALSDGDEDIARRVATYERSHKRRASVLEAAERERARA